MGFLAPKVLSTTTLGRRRRRSIAPSFDDDLVPFDADPLLFASRLREQKQRSSSSSSSFSGLLRWWCSPRFVCASSAWTRAHQSFYTDAELASFYPHHEYVCERCSRSPLTNQSVMMMSRGSQKNASKEGRLSTLSFRAYVMGKNDATKADRQKDRPFRAFFSRPLATCFPHFRCQQYLNTSHRVILTSHAVYISETVQRRTQNRTSKEHAFHVFLSARARASRAPQSTRTRLVFIRITHVTGWRRFGKPRRRFEDEWYIHISSP